jgi:hypothetical protein
MTLESIFPMLLLMFLLQGGVRLQNPNERRGLNMVYPFTDTMVAWVMQLRILSYEGIKPTRINLVDGGVMYYITPSAVMRHRELFGAAMADKWVEWVEAHHSLLLFTFDRSTPFPSFGEGNHDDAGEDAAGVGGVGVAEAEAAVDGVGGEGAPEGPDVIEGTVDEEPEPVARRSFAAAAAAPSSQAARRSAYPATYTQMQHAAAAAAAGPCSAPPRRSVGAAAAAAEPSCAPAAAGGRRRRS